VIATHSPVVLQEVPRSCVWRLRRVGEFVFAERPQLETFGENVGALTQEIFGLEITASGFHQVLTTNLDPNESYEHNVRRYGGQLGSEARALVRTMLTTRPNRSES
jgi:hypothetical protein